LNKYSVPAIALVFDLVLMAIFLIPAPSWQSLVSLNSDLSIIAYASGPVALIVLRKIGTASREGYFKLPMAGIISPIAYVAAILLIYWSGYPTTLYMTAVALAGLAIFGYLLWKKSAAMVDLKNSIWFILTLVSVPIISYVGSMNLDIIQFPFDVFLMAGIAVVFYFIGINTHIEPSETSDYSISGTIAQEQE
ncbi:MAG: amino acid transporter, partial [Candidatus Thermoplasmatota archaeon]|nr:amino acid transporter [Candidatus Thermoplasmatota archaeon]